MLINKWLDKNFNKIKNIRRWLHQHPEVGFDEYKTSEFCQKYMEELGYKVVKNKDMKTGFYCDYGNSGGPTLALRCDMDALPIQEINDIEYKSVNIGVSHACGHDSHMANILGVATFIMENKFNIDGRIRFIFQPAEEIAPGGAAIMIKSGVIKGVDHILGAHILPTLSPEKIGIKYGSMAATVEKIHISIYGPGGHTSRPSESVDLISTQSNLIVSLENVLNKELNENEKVVLAFGKVKGGHTCNVLPSEIILEGTLRYLDSKLKSKLHKLIKNTIKIVERSTNAKIDFEIPHSSPGLENDKRCTDLLISSGIEILGEKNVKIMDESSMGGEDFAYYLEKIPGAYFRVGCSDGRTHDIHTNDFNLDEKCMSTAIKVFVTAVQQYFSK